MAVPSDGSYGVEEGLISGFPCSCSGGEWEIVEGLEIDDFSRQRIDPAVDELKEERDAVRARSLADADRATDRSRTSWPDSGSRPLGVAPAARIHDAV